MTGNPEVSTSIIRRADQIRVVEQGEIVERGTHEALYQLHGRYYDLYTRQQGLESNLFLAPRRRRQNRRTRYHQSLKPLMYTMYMALHVTNEQVEKTVRELAGLAGESVTEAIGKAAAERIERLRRFRPSSPKPTVEEIMALVRSYNLQPINSDLTEDEILGYGPDGIPE